MYRKCREIKYDNKSYNRSILNVSNVRVPSAIDHLLVTELPPVHGKDKVVKFQRDIYFLFNQQRLDRMTLQAFSDYLSSIQSYSGDGLSQLRSKVSDADLLKFVKSRYIQSRSELLAWSQYITANYAQAQQEVKDYLAQQQSETEKQDVEPKIE